MRCQAISRATVAAIVPLLCGQPTSAAPVTAHSDVFATRDITIRNLSTVQSANVTFTFSGQVTALADATGVASASVASSVRFDRVDVPGMLLSNSISAPPSHTGIFPPHSFTFDIAPGGSVLLTSVGSIATDLTVPSPTATGMALGTGVDNEDFTNNSLVNVQIVAAKRASASTYQLSLSGVDPTLFTASASFSVPGFRDELTADGVRTVPLDTTFMATLGPGQTVNSLHTSTNTVMVGPVPEPSAVVLLGIGVAGLVGSRAGGRVSSFPYPTRLRPV